MRKIFADIAWEKKVVVSFAALIILVVLGPFGTYRDLTLGDRFVYWAVLIIGIGAFMHVLVSVALRTPYLGQAPTWARMIIGSMIAAVPSVAILAFVNEVYRPETMSDFNLIVKWGQITLLGLVIGVAEFMDWRRPTGYDVEVMTTALHKRLEPAIGKDIISLSMQDHYVEVTTKEGRALILMRFADALDEVRGLPGLRIHRSHWVAENHVRRMDKDGPRHILTLSDGRTLPVSSTYRDIVQHTMQRLPSGTQK